MQTLFSDAVRRLRGIRHLEWIALLMALALAVLLLLGNRDAGGGSAELSASPLEARMEAVLSQVQGAGKVRVLLQQKPAAAAVFSGGQTQTADSIDGVVVVAEGAGDARVALELSLAVKALLGVDMERIEVLQMRREAAK